MAGRCPPPCSLGVLFRAATRQFKTSASYFAVESLLGSGRRSFQAFNPAVEKSAQAETKRKIKEEKARVKADIVRLGLCVPLLELARSPAYPRLLPGSPCVRVLVGGGDAAGGRGVCTAALGGRIQGNDGNDGKEGKEG